MKVIDMTQTDWYEWLRSQHPLIQAVFRAVQSVGSRALNGADVTVIRGTTPSGVPYVEARTTSMEFKLEYYPDRGLLYAYWERRSKGEDYVEWRVKRCSGNVRDAKAVKDFMDTVEHLLLDSVRWGLEPQRIYEHLKPHAEILGGDPPEEGEG
jgi:hypothetical protein